MNTPPLDTDLIVDAGGGSPNQVWDELLPYLALGYAPGVTSGDRGLCALYALRDSLNAVRIMNENLDPRYIHYSFDRIHAKYRSQEYHEIAMRKARDFSAIPGSSPPKEDPDIFKESMASLHSDNWLSVDNIDVLLECINDEIGTNYRLGYITMGTAASPPIARIHDTTKRGPVVWLHINPGVHWETMVPNQPLAPATGYEDWNVDHLIESEVLAPPGVRRVINDVRAVAPRVLEKEWQMGLQVGQWVRELPNPSPSKWEPPSEDWIWGSLPPVRSIAIGKIQASVVQMKRRVGPVRLSDLSPPIVRVPPGPKARKPIPKEIPPGVTPKTMPRTPLKSIWREGHSDPKRRQPSFSDPPLRMYFAIDAMEFRHPRSTWLVHKANALLLKVDHEYHGAPRMRTIDLREGYVPLGNLERIRRPWGVQRMVPTKGVPVNDRLRYTDSMIGAKSAIQAGAKHLQQEADTHRKPLDIRRLNEAFTLSSPDYDETLLQATRGCNYVRYIDYVGNDQSYVMNIDGYSAIVNNASLSPEPNHWGIFIDTLPFEALPYSPEPLAYSPDSIEDFITVSEEDIDGSQEDTLVNSSEGEQEDTRFGGQRETKLDTITDGLTSDINGYQDVTPAHARSLDLRVTDTFSLKEFVGQWLVSLGLLGAMFGGCRLLGMWPFPFPFQEAYAIASVHGDPLATSPSIVSQWGVLGKRAFEEVVAEVEGEEAIRSNKKLRFGW